MTKPVDLVVIPFHDWRKIQREGMRTRDAHLITHLMSHPEVGRVVIINRPITIAEMVYKQQSWKTEGKLIKKSACVRLVSIGENAFVMDFFDNAVLGPIINGKKWFFSAYGALRFVREVVNCLNLLNIEKHHCISFNLFAVKLFTSLSAGKKLFDGWDNFLKFPEHQRHYGILSNAYEEYSRVADCWTTNSKSNLTFYQEHFNIERCHLISNGVDPDKFTAKYELPADLTNIPRPIIGFGAKATHLLDTELINYLIKQNKDLNFVMVGQILEKDVYRKINKTANFFYLGDKHYDDYPAYVNAFDVCLIPYVVGKMEHGGDSIKFYEYLAANKPVVTTKIEGVSDNYDNIYITNDYAEFSKFIRISLESSQSNNTLPDRLHWKSKANELLNWLLTKDNMQV